MATKKCNWIGESGTKYTYSVFKLPVSFPDDLGNYIFCKSNNQQHWVPIYIGEGNLKDRVTDENHHQSNCIKRKRATHVHAHLTDNKRESQLEETDLLGNYMIAYKPQGCNEKTGG